jgi:glycosyltransferase involved in cell wall biosynthesis
MTQVSLILPAYNEADNLELAVERTAEELIKLVPSFEILLAEDGSTDGTDVIAAELADKYAFVRHLHRDKRLGKGSALKNAFKAAKGSTIAYFDADLSTDMNYLKELIHSIDEEGFDFATGSRLLAESEVKRGLKRETASRVFNFLVRALLRSRLHDHQCGFKSFKRSSLFLFMDEVKDQHWFWDTELLVRAQRRGCNVKEFPIKWHQSTTTRVDFFNDVITMSLKIIGLWWILRREESGK